MHHKRKGPKSTRAGCLLCKPHKRQGAPQKERRRHAENRWLLAARLEIERASRSRSDVDTP